MESVIPLMHPHIPLLLSPILRLFKALFSVPPLFLIGKALPSLIPHLHYEVGTMASPIRSFGLKEQVSFLLAKSLSRGPYTIFPRHFL